MADHNNGGSAFPSHGSMGEVEHRGMTLLDYFAGQALAGLIGAIPGPGCASWDYYSEGAYKIAYAMLAERKKRAAA